MNCLFLLTTMAINDKCDFSQLRSRIVAHLVLEYYIFTAKRSSVVAIAYTINCDANHINLRQSMYRYLVYVVPGSSYCTTADAEQSSPPYQYR